VGWIVSPPLVSIGNCRERMSKYLTVHETPPVRRIPFGSFMRKTAAEVL